ncbi:MFS transporter [Microtetraspora malaysiensis]|uniref:MFS transporter n=1 Tax=Microtetraspora malaysiensis TaxID=161358 RepID=UPI003D8F20D3
MSLTPSSAPPVWRELLGREYLGAAIVLAGGVLVGAINIYLAASLLPTAVADLGGASFYAWNMTIYLVAMVIATMLTGRFLSCWGNVGAYLLGFAMFTAGSMACALSPAMAVLLVSRGVQGLGAGLLSGLGFAVIRSALPSRLWTRGTALMSAMYGVGNFAGPVLGGLFAQAGSWRPAFVVMAVIGAGCGALVPRVLPRGERGAARVPVPALSLLLITAAAGAVSVAGVVAGTLAKALSVAAALLLMAGFVVHERRSGLRVFPRTTYRRGSPLKWVYLTLGLLAFGVAVESFLPLFGQRLAGLPPLVAGFFAAAISLGWSMIQIGSSSVTGHRRGAAAACARPGAARRWAARPGAAAARGHAALAGGRVGPRAVRRRRRDRPGLPALVRGRDVQHPGPRGRRAGGRGDRHRDEPVDRVRHGGRRGPAQPGRRVDARRGPVRAVRTCDHLRARRPHRPGRKPYEPGRSGRDPLRHVTDRPSQGRTSTRPTSPTAFDARSSHD